MREEAGLDLERAKMNGKEKEGERKERGQRAGEVAVRVSKLTKRFKLQWRRGYLLALEGLDLDVKAGEIFGLLGPNGSGKSTTMKLLLGLIEPSEGTVEIFGERAGSMEARRRLGFLPENPYFPSFLSGEEVLKYFGKLCGLRGDGLRKRSRELLEMTGLGEAAKRPLRTYSKGMLQRIGLAQALLSDPDLLLLDEPTAGVDPVGSRGMRDLILDLRDKGKTIVFSSHLLDQVQEVADRVAILHKGEKLCEGPLRELLEVPGELEVRVGGLAEGMEEEVVRLLEKAGGRDVRVRRPQRRLEDFFVEVLPKPGHEKRRKDSS